MNTNSFLKEVLIFNNCLTNGTCENEGWYAPADEVLELETGEATPQGKYFKQGEDFPGDSDDWWIHIPTPEGHLLKTAMLFD